MTNLSAAAENPHASKALPDNQYIFAIAKVRIAVAPHFRRGPAVIPPIRITKVPFSNPWGGGLNCDAVNSPHAISNGFNIHCAAIWPYPGFGPGAFVVWIGENAAGPQRKWSAGAVRTRIRAAMFGLSGGILRGVRIFPRGAQIGPSGVRNPHIFALAQARIAASAPFPVWRSGNFADPHNESARFKLRRWINCDASNSHHRCPLGLKSTVSKFGHIMGLNRALSFCGSVKMPMWRQVGILL